MKKLVFIDSLKKLKNLEEFEVIGTNDKLKQIIVSEYKNKIKKSNVKVITSLNYLLDFIDKNVELYVFKDKPTIFETKPIFPISIPKSGTHLLFELLYALGYKKGEILPSKPKSKRWYYLENSNSHTECKRFFLDKVYNEAFGNRDNFFVTSPSLFIYRHPLDILVSEANYYHKIGRTAFYSYFDGLSFDERVSLLINDKWLLGSVRDRVANFICWLKFPNVIAISFEEIIGSLGGGDDELQLKAIWSIMLKLQIEGSPTEIAKKIYNTKSDTFNKGKIGNFKNELKSYHYEEFKKLNQDFMEELGYDINNIFSKKVDFFRKKMFKIDRVEHPNYLKEIFFFDFNIVKEKELFVGYKYQQGIKLEDDTLEGLKLKILKYWIKGVKC